MKKLFLEDVFDFLKSQEFIFIGTADLKNRPHTSAKPLLKLESDSVYLVDYIIGRTSKNLGLNPKASLSFIDMDKLIGYQLYGQAKVLHQGSEYEKLLHEIHEQQVRFVTKRLVSGVRKGKHSKGSELISLKVVNIFKIKIKEVMQLRPNGDIDKVFMGEESNE